MKDNQRKRESTGQRDWYMEKGRKEERQEGEKCLEL